MYIASIPRVFHYIGMTHSVYVGGRGSDVDIDIYFQFLSLCYPQVPIDVEEAKRDKCCTQMLILLSPELCLIVTLCVNEKGSQIISVTGGG